MKKWIKKGFKYMWEDTKDTLYSLLSVILISVFAWFFPKVVFILAVIFFITAIIAGMGMAIFLTAVPYFDRARLEEREEARQISKGE